MRESQIIINCRTSEVVYEECGQKAKLDYEIEEEEMESRTREETSLIMSGVVAERGLDMDLTHIGERQNMDRLWKSVKERCKEQEIMEIGKKQYRAFEGVLFMGKVNARNKWVVCVPSTDRN